MTLRPLIPLLLALAPTMAEAQAACPADANAALSRFSARAASGEATLPELGDAATTYATGCADDRVVLSQILAMFTTAGLAIEPPAAERFQAHLFAFRTINRILRAGGDDFEPVAFTGPEGEPREWTVLDERNAYWDLVYTMASDFLVYGVHADIYTPGKTEEIGCGIYPAEEASALARLAVGNDDGGELVARVSYLGRACDGTGHEASGYAAQYFAEHAAARAGDAGYAGLTERDIRAGLTGFLDRHLDGAGESWLFDAATVAELRAF
ncbi:hypothetical protein [Sinisalibacter aestuarii]|uniref:Uncharacterized protein n=1 Tax=Sinisalibacter aestuarii TaxID=2949426 RepID=A0ABQ5LV33_9RHOB|nr:hypothetical protein [Sinisalibacter aestuarii]GKY88834.1 hypothetical protein STA1M1_27030 [Sinisalibacter aestuarii]